MSWYAAVEAGGTKFLCAIADRAGHIQQRARFATTTPAATLAQVIEFFRPQLSHGPALGLGIASFGPLDLNPDSASYGHITHTPKAGWSHCDVLGPLQRALACPAAIDTDVNAAALAEFRWGAGRDCDPLIYLTVGTGVGGGVVVHGRPLRGLIHPEMGHLRVQRLPGDLYAGHCPFHGDCVEGLCSGPALHARRGLPAQEWPADDPEWQRLAQYLGRFIAQLLLCFSPQRIVLGGGVMAQSQLLVPIRQAALSHLGGYLQHPRLDAAGDWLLAPALGAESGLRGALALAQDAAHSFSSGLTE